MVMRRLQAHGGAAVRRVVLVVLVLRVVLVAAGQWCRRGWPWRQPARHRDAGWLAEVVAVAGRCGVLLQGWCSSSAAAVRRMVGPVEGRRVRGRRLLQGQQLRLLLLAVLDACQQLRLLLLLLLLLLLDCCR
jgi:hypothetical protein